MSETNGKAAAPPPIGAATVASPAADGDTPAAAAATAAVGGTTSATSNAVAEEQTAASSSSSSKNKKKKNRKKANAAAAAAAAAATAGGEDAGAGNSSSAAGANGATAAAADGDAAARGENGGDQQAAAGGGGGNTVAALGSSDGGGASASAGPSASAMSNGADILRMLKKQQIESAVARAGAAAAGKGPKEHKFWDTQPMKKPGEEPEEPGEIETKTIDDVKPEPYNMPPGFEWCHVDVMDAAEAEEVYTLLSENYVEDDDNMFRFDYSKEFLRWALTPPGYSAELHVGVRSSKGKLMGLITAVPTQMRVMDSSIKTVEINFLCVHKKLRAKRLAPVLIKEITRRVNRMGVWQAVYTAGVVLPTPLACCRYYHRSLNPKKLIEVGFSRLANRMTMARTMKLYKLPDSTNSANVSAMQPEDVPSAHALLSKYLEQFKLAPQLSEEEFAHWLLPREGVVDCFVVKDRDGKVTDMCSFYHLPSTVIGHAKHRTLNAAYSFYNVATTVSMTELMRDSLVLARNLGMDVFNALNLMQNQEFLQTLKFGIGDGHLQYYLFNWRCKEITPQEVGLVLL
ncbi:unnamed protein product [Ectocarpus sp. 13 AM-2016]